MLQWKSYRGALLALLVTALLTSCGFHLRGNIPLPDGIKNMYLVAPKGTFSEQLSASLTRGGAEIASNRAAAAVILNVTEARSDRTVGTLDERGRADSYNLVFTASYTLNDPEGKQIRSESLTESRRYQFDPALVIESEAEEADLLEEMEQAMSLRIVRQLSSMTTYPPKTQ